nr:TonB-dependent receptor plug domain-containing protein [uncultured Sphingomonas sp.]
MNRRIILGSLMGSAFLLTPTVVAARDVQATDGRPTDVLAAPATADTGPAPVDAKPEEKGEKKQVDALLDMSLEELLSQQVTSVAKKSGRVADSAAAVTVITQEDIRRSSARTVPDLLRMVPGMEVAEVQSSATSVSARGFTSRFAANLLVMVDGAAIYSTSISGMFWDQALIPLQDIERIEVVRGPGGTLWGSNSISGIVNIITKQSVDTQGLRVDGSIGTYSRRLEVAYGKELNENLGFRIYGDYRATDGLDGPHGAVPDNSWKGGLAGIRFDYAPSDKDNVVVLGELS